MKNLIDFALKQKYEKVKKLKSNIEEINKIINWNSVAQTIPIKRIILEGRLITK